MPQRDLQIDWGCGRLISNAGEKVHEGNAGYYILAVVIDVKEGRGLGAVQGRKVWVEGKGERKGERKRRWRRRRRRNTKLEEQLEFRVIRG